MFTRVVREYQCFPGAMYAILRSADEVLGTKFCAKNDMQDLNRRMGFGKAGTPANGGLLLRRYLRTYGLTYREDYGESGSYRHLQSLIVSPQASHPLVSVSIGLATADVDTEFVGEPTDIDHVIVVLEIHDQTVEYFDATAHPQLHGEMGMVETAPLEVFLKFWGLNYPVPYLRGWIEKAPPSTRGARAKSGPSHHPLEGWATKGVRRK